MSVLVVTDHYRTIRRVISCLNAQTVRDQLEIVIVAPAGADLGLDEEALEGFAGVCRQVATFGPRGPDRAVPLDESDY